jgi:hypothetical protein
MCTSVLPKKNQHMAICLTLRKHTMKKAIREKTEEACPTATRERNRNETGPVQLK